MLHQNTVSPAEKGAYLSIVAYLFMAALKLIIGYIGNSKGLWADGLNNSTDIIASIAVLIGLKISKRPADHNHRYGHLRAETIASLIAAFIMMYVGIQVIFNAIQSFTLSGHEEPSAMTAYVSIFSALFMYGIYRYNLALSVKIKSAAINAVAQDNKSDALVSVGAFVGIIGTKIGLPWLDSVAAVAVGLIICKTAFEIFKESSHSLTDGFDEKSLQDIQAIIKMTDGVIETSDVKARMHGNEILVEATVHVDPELNVVESHNITVSVEENLYKDHSIKRAIIHIEPYNPKK